MIFETNDETKRYEPDVQEADDLLGLAMNSAKGGEQVKVLQKDFFTSYEDNHRYFFDQILCQIPKLNLRGLNEVLIVIRDKKYHIYYDYPIMMEIRPKVDIPAGRAVFENQILDIRAVRFKDTVVDLDIKDGDKFVWLFRVGWSFGLYFDLSGKMRTSELWKELGGCYKNIKYHSLYSFLSVQENFGRLLELGWFPFVQILGAEFDTLRFGIDNAEGITIIEEGIVDSFTAERIRSFTKYWWENEIFERKKGLISAGLNAYESGGSDGIVNCITTLTGQIEGIVRLDYHRTKGRSPDAKELMKYLKNRANENFPDHGSLGFPGRFLGYIENVFFRPFDIEKDDVELSRHSVAHGVANQERFTKIRALQLILVLDQIHFYLQSNKIA